MSLRDVRKLLDDKSRGESAFGALDTLLGMLIALAPVALGPAGLALWPLLEPKGELVAACGQSTAKFTKAQPRDYLEQARNMAAANCLLTYTAYFDALGQRLPGLVSQWQLSEADKRLIAAPAAGQGADTGGGGKVGHDLADRIISVPHSVTVSRLAPGRWSGRLDLYSAMTARLLPRLIGLGAWDALSGEKHAEALNALTSDVPTLAEEMFRAEYAGLAADFPGSSSGASWRTGRRRTRSP